MRVGKDQMFVTCRSLLTFWPGLKGRCACRSHHLPPLYIARKQSRLLATQQGSGGSRWAPSLAPSRSRERGRDLPSPPATSFLQAGREARKSSSFAVGLEKKRGKMGRLSSATQILSLLVVCALAARPAVAGVAFSSLPRTLVLSASPKEGQVLRAGEDTIIVSWALNRTLPSATDATYKKVKVRLCYAPVSQTDRAWRKTNNDLGKDKTCQFGVTIQPYTGAGSKDFKYQIERDVPSATYFVRAYVLDASGVEVAYGQSTNAGKTQNLFEIQGISGRHTSLDIAAACFSAFSVVSLIAFFVAEKRGFKK